MRSLRFPDKEIICYSLDAECPQSHGPQRSATWSRQSLPGEESTVILQSWELNCEEQCEPQVPSLPLHFLAPEVISLLHMHSHHDGLPRILSNTVDMSMDWKESYTTVIQNKSFL